MGDTGSSKVPAWSHLLLAGVLVTIVAGAFWLKSRPALSLPKLFANDATGQEPVEALLARGVKEHNAGSLDAAMDLYFKVLKRDPSNSQAHYNIAQIYNVRGQLAEAQWEYEATLKANPKALDARLNLGVVLYRQRQFDAAAEAFREVLKTSPKHSLALFNLGVTLFEQGHADKAIPWLNAALREDSKRAETYYYLGLAQQKLGRLSEAGASLEKATELNPKHANAIAALVKVYLLQGERQKALDLLSKTKAQNPTPAK